MKRLILMLSLVATAMVGVASARAQEPVAQPVLVVSVRNFDSLVANLKFLGKVLDDSQYLVKLANATKLLTKGDAIKVEEAAGIDGQKPLGIAIYSDGQSIRQLSFLPVSDADAVFTWLKPLVGDVTKTDDGLYQIASPRLNAFAKVENGFMFLATSPEQLAKLPDPLQTVEDLPSKYQVALRANFAKVPEDIRGLVIDQLRARMESGTPTAGEPEAAAAFRRETTAFLGRLFDRFANESEHATMGSNLSEESTQLLAQIVIKPLPDTGLAKHFAELGTQTTRFGGLFTNSDKPMLSLGMTGKLAPEMVGDIKTELEAYRTAANALFDASTDVKSDEDRQLFKDLGGSLIDALQASAAAGTLDVAVKIPGTSPLTVVAAINITGGDAIIKQLDRLAEATKDDPESGFKADEAKQGDVRIHSFAAPTSPEFATLTKGFGKSRLYLAVNETTLYVAFGGKGLDLIKQAIDVPAQEGVTPLRVAGRGTGLIRLMPQPSGGGQNAQLLTSIVSMQLSSGDGFNVVGTTPEGNLVIDMTFDKGFVRLGAFAGPLLGQFLFPTLDLNNLGGTFGF